MENSFGTGGLFRGPGGDKEPAKIHGFDAPPGST